MPVKLVMTVGGGYALVHKPTQKRFDIASITPTPSTPLLHRLVVRLVGGATSEPELPEDGLDLNATPAKRMEVWPGGVVPTAVLTPPDLDDRTGLLPDVPELGRSALSPEWPSKISARITLRAGRLKVGRLSVGTFQFRHLTRPPKPIQKVANGVDGLVYEISDQGANSVDLVLFPLGTTDAQILGPNPPVSQRFVLRPPAGSSLIRLQVQSFEPDKDMEDRMDLEEFRAFYNLLEPVPLARDQYVPRWFASPSFDVSPGSECPPGYYDDNKD